jgi:hypothetical protein
VPDGVAGMCPAIAHVADTASIGAAALRVARSAVRYLRRGARGWRVRAGDAAASSRAA